MSDATYFAFPPILPGAKPGDVPTMGCEKDENCYAP